MLRAPLSTALLCWLFFLGCREETPRSVSLPAPTLELRAAPATRDAGTPARPARLWPAGGRWTLEVEWQILQAAAGAPELGLRATGTIALSVADGLRAAPKELACHPDDPAVRAAVLRAVEQRLQALGTASAIVGSTDRGTLLMAATGESSWWLVVDEGGVLHGAGRWTNEGRIAGAQQVSRLTLSVRRP